MRARIFWGAVFGSLVALVWVGYRRGAFDNAGDKMRIGMERIKGRLQMAGDKARQQLAEAKDRASAGLESLSGTARQKAQQVQSRVEHILGR